MSQVLQVIDFLLWLYILLILARLVFDIIQSFSANWRPHGPALVAAEGIYTVTDPPVRLARRLIPVVRIGPVSLDLSLMVVLLALYLIRAIL